MSDDPLDELAITTEEAIRRLGYRTGQHVKPAPARRQRKTKAGIAIMVSVRITRRRDAKRILAMTTEQRAEKLLAGSQ